MYEPKVPRTTPSGREAANNIVSGQYPLLHLEPAVNAAALGSHQVIVSDFLETRFTREEKGRDIDLTDLIVELAPKIG